MPEDTVDLSPDDLRAVAGYAAACAGTVLAIFETARPGDVRPRAAVEAALAFAGGAARSKALRGAAWAAPAGGGRVGELMRRLDAALRLT